MKNYLVLINGEAIGSVDASDYLKAKVAARAAFGRRCDVIGPK